MRRANLHMHAAWWRRIPFEGLDNVQQGRISFLKSYYIIRFNKRSEHFGSTTESNSIKDWILVHSAENTRPKNFHIQEYSQLCDPTRSDMMFVSLTRIGANSHIIILAVTSMDMLPKFASRQKSTFRGIADGPCGS